MTLQQLKYVIYIAECGTLGRAAEKMYVSQPSLSTSLKELEQEIGVQIFTRNNRGLVLTTKGSEFLSYARQVVEQYSLIEDKYISKKLHKEKFSVSSQHYSFVIKAFIKMAKKFDMDEYEFAVRETKTHEVIDDIRHMHSELGILFLNEFNTPFLTKIFKDYDLHFTKLFTCNIYVYLHSSNPLATKKQISLDELQEYPCLSFEQGDKNSFFFAEEVLSTYNFKRSIKANDRATMLNLMKGLNAYTLCSGIISQDLNGNGYTAIPLDISEQIDIGYIKKKGVMISELGQAYLKELKEEYEKQI